MSEFLQVELEASQTKAARHREEHAEEPHQKRSRGTVAKRTRAIGLSAKRTRRESKAEVLSKGTSTSGAEPEPSHPL